MRLSDWGSDVGSSDLLAVARLELVVGNGVLLQRADHRDVVAVVDAFQPLGLGHQRCQLRHCRTRFHELDLGAVDQQLRVDVDAELLELERIQFRRQHRVGARLGQHRSEEHTSELQSLMRISYAVFCLKKKKKENERLVYIKNI